MSNIMVIKRELLFGKNDEDSFEGFMPVHQKDFFDKVMKNFVWMEREEAEQDFSFKQPIPYVLVFNSTTNSFFAYRRAVKGYNEKRLAGKWSLGIGGHVEPHDNSENPILTAMFRELNEEIVVNPRSVKLVGFINNDVDSVGRVHFGFCYLIDTEESITINDPALEDGSTRSPEEIENMLENCENWSNIAYTHVKNLVSRPGA